MKINMFCRMVQSGVGRHAQYFYETLRQSGDTRVTIHHVDIEDQRAIAEAIVAGTSEDVSIFFVTQAPQFLQMIKGRKILWCAFESSHMPKNLIARLDAFDEVWAPSAWGQGVMIASGLAAAKVKTFHEGVDGAVYFPKSRAHEGCIFLSVAKYEKRKGIDELIEAFIQEFPADKYKNVSLWLKADFPLFPGRIDELKNKISGDARVKLIEGHASDDEMVTLYNMADAFVYPSRAEGFGLPCIEALACGVPVIATSYSGQTEYLNCIPDMFVPIQYVLEDIEDQDFDHFYRELYAGEPYGQWAKPDINSLRQGMRQVYEHKKLWKDKALQASQIIRQNFDWKNTVEKALAELLA